MNDAANTARRAGFRWLPPALRPNVPMSRDQERTFLLVGAAALFAGYDMNIYGFAIPQIQASLHIPENQVGLTVTYFRFASFVAIMLAASADIVGRRRLLLITIFCQAIATLATAFSQTYAQFVWAQIATRIFGYTEEMLCIVVIAEEMADRARGWANGTLAAMSNTGAGIASLVFAFVNILPYHWRALYVIGALPIFIVGFLRRRLPETRRFQIRDEDLQKLTSRVRAAADLAGRLATEYPGRLALILIGVAAFGFAIAPAVVLGTKYLQQTLGFAPWQTTLLMVPGGFVALGLNVAAGRISDRIGRKPVVISCMALCAFAFGVFYSGIQGWIVAPAWVLAFFGYFASEALLSGFALEIVPTAYRATVSGLRYTVEILMGGLSLALEGVSYDHFHGHGPAISVALLAMPICLVAILFLPEPAGRRLEEIAG